jgi:hypothetical protein
VSISQDDKRLNRESKTPSLAKPLKRVDKELIIKPKRKYIRKPLPKTRDD